MYEMGHGVAPNIPEAIKWYSAAASSASSGVANVRAEAIASRDRLTALGAQQQTQQASPTSISQPSAATPSGLTQQADDSAELGFDSGGIKRPGGLCRDNGNRTVARYLRRWVSRIAQWRLCERHWRFCAHLQIKVMHERSSALATCTSSGMECLKTMVRRTAGIASPRRKETPMPRTGSGVCTALGTECHSTNILLSSGISGLPFKATIVECSTWE